MAENEKRHLALVTGTSAGIGQALALALLEEDWEVVGISRRPAEMAHELYRHWPADLGSADDLETLIQERLQPLLGAGAHSRVALINNAAGMGQLTRFSGFNAPELQLLLAINVAAPMRLLGAALRAVSPTVPLRVVNISSGAAHTPIPGLGDYCATKAALRLAGQTAAVEMSQEGRNAAVFSYEPGVVETGMQVAARSADPECFPSRATFQGFMDKGILARPEEVVGPVLAFVAGDPEEAFSEARYQPGS